MIHKGLQIEYYSTNHANAQSGEYQRKSKKVEVAKFSKI